MSPAPSHKATSEGLHTAIANLVVASVIKALNSSISSGVFFGYAGMALLAGIAMTLMARRFKVRDYYQQGGPIPVGAHAAPPLDSKKP